MSVMPEQSEIEVRTFLWQPLYRNLRLIQLNWTALCSELPHQYKRSTRSTRRNRKSLDSPLIIFSLHVPMRHCSVSSTTILSESQ